MSSFKWIFPALVCALPAYAEFYIVQQPQYAQFQVVQQPQVVWVVQPQQRRQVQYYRPQPATQNKAYWNGGSVNNQGTFGVNQTHQTGAQHQCTHGPNGTTCTNKLHADRQYQFTNNGVAYANGEYKNALGGKKVYTHNGDAGTVAAIDEREQNVATTNKMIATTLQETNRLNVEIKAMRERLLLSRNGYNYVQVDQQLQQLATMEEEVNDARSQLTNVGSRLNQR